MPLALVMACALGIVDNLPRADVPGLHGSISAGGRYHRAAEKAELRGAASASWVGGRLSAFAGSAASLSRAGGIEYGRDQSHHARLRAAVAGPLSVEIFSQHESDRYGPLTSRSLAGAGARVTLLNRALFAGLGGFFEREANTPGLARASGYLELRPVSGDVSVSLVAFFQPAIGRWYDRRAMLKASATSRIAGPIHLGWDVLAVHDTRPAGEGPRLDVATSSSLMLDF